METLASTLNRIIVCLLVLTSAIIFFAAVIQMSSLFMMLLTGTITVISIGVANLTFRST
jgi:hypothetical protein